MEITGSGTWMKSNELNENENEANPSEPYGIQHSTTCPNVDVPFSGRIECPIVPVLVKPSGDTSPEARLIWRAGSGAPFRVHERKSERTFLAQLKPYDDALKRTVDIHNSLDHRGIEQYHQVVRDGQLALVVFENADTTLDGLSILTHPDVEMAEPEGMDREKMVRVFMRQLLLALKHMHDLRIAHLDLRPEVILLQDTRLKLADFGQARRLLRGLITGEIKGTPEFVSPEIVRALPLTLATDMFSVGTLSYVLLTGISPFLGDNDNETLANVDRCQYDANALGVFSWDAKDFITKLLVEIPRNRLTVDEALDHPWLNDDAVKDAPLSADSLREFKYRYKWLERRVFVQQTPSEQIIEAILGPPTLVAQKEAERKAKLAAEAARPVESYDYLRVKPRAPPQVEEVPRKRIEHQPYVNEFGEIIDPRAFDPYAIPHDPGFSDDYPPYERGVPQPPQPGPRPRDSRSRGLEPRDSREHRRPMVDQYGRPLHPEELLAKQPWDVQGRPIGMDDQQYMVDKYGRPVMPEDVKRAQQFGPVPIDKYGRPIHEGQEPQHHEKRKLIPQDKGETPSKMKREPPKEPPKEDQDIMKVPLRMIRGERREIEEEIANRILSDISEEGSVAGSLGSLDDFDMPTIAQKLPEPQRGAEQRPRSRSSTPKAESDASTPTLSPDDTTVKEGVFFPKDKDAKPKETQPKREPDGRKGIKIPGSEIKFYPDTALAGLPPKDKEILERAENDPNIPVGCPLILEDLHGQGLIIGDSTPRGPSKKEKGWSKQGHKSTVVVTPSKEHSMEVLIATKRGKPSFLDPDEEVPDLDDEDARMDDRKKKAKRSKHDGKDDFRDESDQLEKDRNRRTVDLSDLDKYRPKNFYKDDLDFERPDYDIDDDPWDSHYQIGPDTYLMATRGPAFNSRVRDYRRTLFGDGAPTVKQGFLGVRNRDVTVRERRRFTDILRESQQNLKPKSQNEHVSSVERAPTATAIERIKADIEKVAPSATKRNDDGTYAPIFISRLRDVYLSKTRPALFECSVIGSPAPKVQWTFQGKILENDSKYAIEQVNNIARLTVNDPAAFDLGEYVCSASNEYGGDKTTSRLISGEAPDRPGRPDAELASDTELFITWEPPEHVTYLEGITYRLEYRVAGPDDHGAPWITVSDNIDDEAVVVKHLQPLGIYQFRVTARNGFGLGLPSLTSRIVQTHAKGTPKLQIGTLRGEFRLNVVSIPHKSMEGISEESEEESIRTLLDQPSSSDLTLNTSDPKSRFQIDTLMFKGRFSVIRQAIDSSTEAGSHCIAKIRHPADNKAIQREFDTLRDSQHENVQVLIAAHTFDNFLYLFCERLYEDVFSRFVFNDYYNEEQIALTVRQIAAGLHFLHFRGVVHLDVNPHNVMFQSKRSWIVKLVDFGSAQYLKDAVKPEEFDVKWAAPEFHIKDTPVTVQSDMWGLGVVTFCLLAGFHPFTSEYDQEKEIKDNVLNVKCDPNLIPVNASQESLSFVTWALKKSPLRRMRTDEALSHRFLSTDPSMVRRREAIKYAASRLRKIAALTRQNQSGRPLSNELENTYGAKNLS